MGKKRILFCVGTRPNLIKITQFEKAFEAYPNLEFILLHTGQHYDDNMNNVFFKELAIKKPDIHFVLDPGSQVSIIIQIMEKFEQTCLELKPDLVVVPGDVNSSFACAFVASRFGIPVAHVESGLRSFDSTMPEEINRVLIDKLAELHFVTEQSGLDNLRNENHSEDTIKFVGNTMIDTLVAFEPNIDKSEILKRLSITLKDYLLFTFHRPVNVDEIENLKKLIKLIKEGARLGKVVFPVHPRTLKNLKAFNLYDEIVDNEDIVLTQPLGYFDFLHLVKNASIVVTDSGGIQEETTFMQVPCLTVRPNTERPITTDIGSNQLLDFDINEILKNVESVLTGNSKKGEIPKFWDGSASTRILQEINNFFK